jgi:hypothetical protein
MEPIITWKIVNIKREISDGYAFDISWEAIAEEGDYNSRAYGSVHLNRPDGNLIPFEDLTEELVISWVKNQLEKDNESLNSSKSVEDYLLEDIQNQKNPPIAVELPW